MVFWSWDICTDTCAICRNALYEPSIEAQANPGLADEHTANAINANRFITFGGAGASTEGGDDRLPVYFNDTWLYRADKRAVIGCETLQTTPTILKPHSSGSQCWER